MFKVMNKLRSDKRGFTLVELMVTMVILVIALTLTVELMGVIWQNYRLVEYRWIIQTAVEYVAACFQQDAHSEAVATADRANLFYDSVPTITSGEATFYLPSVPELGSFTYNADDKTLKVDPTGVSDDLKEVLKERCIYFITCNDHFYIIRYDDVMSWTTGTDGKPVFSFNSVTKRPLVQELDLIEDTQADIEIKIDFAISGNVLQYNTTDHRESKPGESGAAYSKYITNAITGYISGAIQDVNDSNLRNTTEFNASIDMLNMLDQQSVNYTSGNLTSRYVAGWDKGNITGYPSSLVTADGASAQAPTSRANIVKYHSVNTPIEFSDSVQNKAFKINVKMPICLFMSLSTGYSDQVQMLEPLRDFRDNILRGNAVGEWVIDKYYDWSPTVISWTNRSPALKSALRIAAKGLAEVATVIAE